MPSHNSPAAFVKSYVVQGTAYEEMQDGVSAIGFRQVSAKGCLASSHLLRTCARRENGVDHPYISPIRVY